MIFPWFFLLNVLSEIIKKETRMKRRMCANLCARLLDVYITVTVYMYFWVYIHTYIYVYIYILLMIQCTKLALRFTGTVSTVIHNHQKQLYILGIWLWQTVTRTSLELLASIGPTVTVALDFAPALPIPKHTKMAINWHQKHQQVQTGTLQELFEI